MASDVLLFFIFCLKLHITFLVGPNLDCDSQPCAYDGTCTATSGVEHGYICHCNPGTEGQNCNTVANQCFSSPCQHNGVCNGQSISYKCDCTAGYEGTNCEQDINECASSPCMNGGVCVNEVNKYSCNCDAASGYSGTRCQDYNECISNPCQNGGTCNDLNNEYSCKCKTGWLSRLLKDDNGKSLVDCTERDDCVYPNPHKCKNGQCVDGDGEYTCTCDLGWTGNLCDIEIDECESVPCQYNGHCNDSVASYICTCIPGITGANCQTDIDECASNPCNAKDVGATCIDQINGVKCTCSPDWTSVLCDLDLNVWKITEKFKDTIDLSAVEDIIKKSSTITDSVPFLVGQLNQTLAATLSWNFTDVFQYCTFGGENCDMPNDIYQWFEPTMGNCFTFNHASVFNKYNYFISRAGMGHGLELILKAGQEEYAPWTDVAGNRVFVHNQSEIVYAESVGYAAPPGYITTLGLRYVVYKRLSEPYGNCIEHKGKLKYFYYTGAYSTEGCFRSCYQNEVFKKCKCMDPRYPTDKNKLTCPLEEKKSGNPKDWDCSEVKNCPLPCESGEYGVTVSRTRFPEIPPDCEDLTGTEQEKCINDVTKNLMKVELYFEEVGYLVYKENPRYPVFKLLSDVGGQLGILCGMSAISMTEIVFMAVQVIFTYVTGC